MTGGVDKEVGRWETEAIRSWLLGFAGIGEKTAACVLLYKMKRLDFAVDANVLRIGTRLGWFDSIGKPVTHQ